MADEYQEQLAEMLARLDEVDGASCFHCRKVMVAADDVLVSGRGLFVCDACWRAPQPRLAAWKVLAWIAGLCAVIVVAVALLG
jgi:hypothetical protein